MTPRMVTWAPGCVCRRQSPGKGALEPHPAPHHCPSPPGERGVRGELSQAPSLGTAKHLGAFPVWKGVSGGRGLVQLTGLVCPGMSANPRLTLPESPVTPWCQLEPSNPAVSIYAFGFC